MQRRASLTALAAEAHAVETAVLGPHKPYLMETLPAAELGIILGMTKGLMPRGPPPRTNFLFWDSNSLRPPMPLPMMTPQRKGSSLAKSMPQSLTASMAAT